MEKKYEIGDKFLAKGCKEYGFLELKYVIEEDNRLFYILENLKYKQTYKVPDTHINLFYYPEN